MIAKMNLLKILKVNIFLLNKNLSCIRNYSNISIATIEEFASYLLKSEKILVMTGAGLSTASGIPDFRSPKTGLYYNLQKYKLPYAEAIFDINYFRENPLPFFDRAKELYPGVKYRPNIGHYFLKLLDQKKKLLRVFTQNIDGLERLAGVPPEKLVEAHGTFYSASCIECGKSQDPEQVKKEIFSDKVVRCVDCNGLVKPDIVFFGEMLPERFTILSEHDTDRTDLLIVIGTSLEVYPFAGLANAVGYHVPRLLINKGIVGSFGMRDHDAILDEDIIKGILHLADNLKWRKELEKLYEEGENNVK